MELLFQVIATLSLRRTATAANNNSLMSILSLQCSFSACQDNKAYHNVGVSVWPFGMFSCCRHHQVRPVCTSRNMIHVRRHFQLRDNLLRHPRDQISTNSAFWCYTFCKQKHIQACLRVLDLCAMPLYGNAIKQIVVLFVHRVINCISRIYLQRFTIFAMGTIVQIEYVLHDDLFMLPDDLVFQPIAQAQGVLIVFGFVKKLLDLCPKAMKKINIPTGNYAS